MDTRVYTAHPEVPEAAETIKSGGMVAVPTETVYGLCVNGLNEKAVAELYEVKGRPEVKPLSLMVDSPAAMDQYCTDVPAAAYILAERFWPGPLTIVLSSKDIVPGIVRAGGTTVGLRCPDHPLTLALLKECALPLAGPSANPSGMPSPRNAAQVLSYFNGKIDAVIDGGECGFGRESTIIDMSCTPFRILRQGALSEEAVTDALCAGMKVIGITGGTGTGKTTALHVLEEKGALTLDCDAIYHELLAAEGEMLSAIGERFPGTVTSGVLDRKLLGRIVFSDADALADLNAITHRHVRAEVQNRLRDWAWRGGTLAAVDAIALLESGLGKDCDITVAVTAKRETRLERIMAREGITAEYAASRIDAQPDDVFFETHCDHTLANDGTQKEFEEKCRTLFGTL